MKQVHYFYTMRFAIAIFCLLIFLPGARAQQLTKRVYTPDDGLTQLETKGMFVLPDSQIVVVQVDGTCTYFDGYNFYPMEDNLGLPKGFVHWSIHLEEYSYIGIANSEGKTDTYILHKDKSLFKATESMGLGVRIFCVRDTLFFRNIDTIKYYDGKIRALVYSHTVHSQFSRQLLENVEIKYVEGADQNDLVCFNQNFYRKNKKGQ